MSNFDAEKKSEFFTNPLQTLAQWSLGIEVVCYDFVKNSQFCAFIQDFLDHYVDGCWSNDVDIRRSPRNESSLP